jgi:RimJ/RimL family protein N-acetyltransferase
MVELETARLRLRRWREDDLDAYARICADPEVMRYMGGPLTRDETERRIEKIVRGWEERGFGLWAVEEKTSGALSAGSGSCTTRTGPRASTRPRSVG